MVILRAVNWRLQSPVTLLGKQTHLAEAQATDAFAASVLPVLPQIQAIGMKRSKAMALSTRGARAARDLIGRSGGIRTHDPQSPRLMRYQTALRSDEPRA